MTVFYPLKVLTGNRYYYILFTSNSRSMGGAVMDVERGLRGRVRTGGGEVVYGVYGEGSPVVLVHGTPSRSRIWRKVVPRLAERHAVYVYDLPGFGESERWEGQDVSIAAQGRVLAELVEAWGLEEPAVAGHDIGGGIVLRAHLLEGVAFKKISLLDAVVLTPWGTPALRHVREHLGAYRTMPTDVFEAYVAARLKGTTSGPVDEETFEAYLSQWRGPDGQAAYLRKDAALVERDTADVERLLGNVRGPVMVVWGGEDAWLDPSQAETLTGKIPGAEHRLVPGAGHFVMEDAPGKVAEILTGFFAETPRTGSLRGVAS
jgi:pimeloyl-ACP methyl ester carboxylesterase